jgi:hypothetical protein
MLVLMKKPPDESVVAELMLEVYTKNLSTAVRSCVTGAAGREARNRRP